MRLLDEEEGVVPRIGTPPLRTNTAANSGVVAQISMSERRPSLLRDLKTKRHKYTAEPKRTSVNAFEKAQSTRKVVVKCLKRK